MATKTPKPQSHIGHTLRPRTKLSRRALGFLAAIFGLVGIVTIFASSASGRPLVIIQAEKLQPQYWVAFPFTDQQATDKRALIYFGNVTATSRSFEISEAATEVTVRARAQKCFGDPQYQLQVDGKAVGMHTVRSAGYNDYTTTTQIPAGKHTVGIRYINDGWSWRCDRNLIVDQITLKTTVRAPAQAPVPAQGQNPKPGSGSSPDGQTSGDQQGTQAKSATAFVDSVGVNTHIGYGHYPYNDIAKVKAGLQKLGIRNIRDGDYLNNPQAQAKLKTLFDAGIKATILTHVEELDQQIALIKSYPKGSVVAVESINEPDCFLAEKRSDWIQATRTHQKQLWDKVNGDPSFNYIDILGTSYCRGATYQTVGDLSANFEYNNFHPYPGGNPPEASLDYNLNLVKPVSGSKPFYATETGYHNALYTPYGHLPTSQRATGVYMPRLFLNSFEMGVKRTLSYELVDQRPYNNWNLTFDHEGNFGLLAHDFSEKPAGTAIRRLMSILNDTNTSFKPGKLSYTLTGDTSNIKQVLLQKSNGNFYLALWRTDSVWNNQQRYDLPVVNKPLSVKLGKAAQEIKVYNVAAADAPTSTTAGEKVDLNLGPEVQILEIKK